MATDTAPFDNSSSQDILLPTGESFFALLTYLPRQEIEEVEDAFKLAEEEHGDAKRKSGEPFICHPLTVASYLAEYYADSPTLIAALLHDVAEDAEVTVRDIEHRYGSEVSRIVDGVTKFDKVTGEAKLGKKLSKQELATATHYKLFKTMENDLRVGLVKIFDRLHNMRTLKFLPFYKQEEKARETLQVYAPLANKLGMWQIKNELETLALDILYPSRFKQFCKALDDQKQRNEAEFPALEKDLTEAVEKAKIELVKITEAPIDTSGAFRIWREEQESKIRFAPPQPVILLKNEIDCYTALGHIHGRWRPVAGQFDDYISASRHNLYRSLHTTVIYKGRRVKIRIRTLEMQLESQNGILSRWTDTMSMPIWAQEAEKKVSNVFNRLPELDEEDESTAYAEKVRHILDDVFENQITVFTPNGDAIELPRGATAVDFAYRIHTEVGHGCRGVLVNSERQPLTYVLQDGDSILIEKEPDEAKPHPQFAWLDENLGYIRTRTGRQGARRWFKKLPLSMARQIGRTMLQNELDGMGLPYISSADIARKMNFKSEGDLFQALGRVEILVADVSNKLLTDLWDAEDEAAQTVYAYKNEFVSSQAVFSKDGDMYIIEHSGDRQLQLCTLCQPRPGDSIVGAISRKEQVMVHTEGCRLLTPDTRQGGKTIQLRWGAETDRAHRAVTLKIYAHDREGLLNDITNLFKIDKININFLWSKTEHFKALIIFSADVTNTTEVVGFLHRANHLSNVIHAAYMGPTHSDHVIPEKFFDGNPECNLKELEKTYVEE
ncbi:MAG: HD domain-containing protein [Chloroflexota bacterium]